MSHESWVAVVSANVLSFLGRRTLSAANAMRLPVITSETERGVGAGADSAFAGLFLGSPAALRNIRASRTLATARSTLKGSARGVWYNQVFP